MCSAVTPTDTNRCLTHTFTHSHTREEEEAWASLAMMRTGSCHRLSIPCMSPMARNKLVTALPATLSGYLRCTGLCQAPLLSYCCAFACVCVYTQEKEERLLGYTPRHLLNQVVIRVQHFIWPASGVTRGPSPSTRGSRGFTAAPLFLLRVRHTVGVTTVTAACRVNLLWLHF